MGGETEQAMVDIWVVIASTILLIAFTGLLLYVTRNQDEEPP